MREPRTRRRRRPRPALEARRLVRAAGSATLATQADGQPFASLVTPAAAPDLSPLLWLSTLSEHTRQLRAEPRCALLFTGDPDRPNPQTTPRVTLTGQAEPVDGPEAAALKARWLARHPYAALYADFGDFALWRVAPGGALLVGGFARAVRLRLAELLPDPAAVAAVAAAEAGIIDHVNADHADAVAAIAEGLLGQAAAGIGELGIWWRWTWTAPTWRLASACAACHFLRPVASAEASGRSSCGPRGAGGRRHANRIVTAHGQRSVARDDSGASVRRNCANLRPEKLRFGVAAGPHGSRRMPVVWRTERMTAAETALAGTGVPAPGTPSMPTSRPRASTSRRLRRGEGRLSADGAFMAITGVHTGRSVQDKFVVDDPEVHDEIWWGKVNQPMAPERFRGLRGRVLDWLGERPVLFTQDLYAGADPAHRIRVRLVTTNAWHALFARNMFIRPPEEELAGFRPDFTILHAPEFEADPAPRRLPLEHLHRAVLRGEDDPDRRHQLRRRDQEDHLHRDELAAAGARRAADALLRQRRRRTATRRCSSACPAPARPRCPPTPSAA